MFLYNEENHPLSSYQYNKEDLLNSDIVLESLILNEDYFGKHENLILVEREIEKIKEQIELNPTYVATYTKENKKIEDLIAKTFNFEAVEITWIPSRVMVNAMTFPVANMFFAKYSNFDIENKQDGIRFKTNKGKICKIYVYNAMFNLLNLTSEDLLAALLHEIGHNFYVSKTTFYIRKITTMMASVAMPFIFTAKGRSFAHRLRDKKLVQKLLNISNRINAFVYDSMKLLTDLTLPFNIPFLFKENNNGVLNIVEMIKKQGSEFISSLLLGSYVDEKFADNFATMYGYGPALSNVMKLFETTNKMNTVSKQIQGITTLANIYNATSFILTSVLTLGDCHPNNYERVYDQAKFLEKELSKETNPIIRKELTEQLKQIEKIYETMASDEYLKENNEEFKRIFYKLVGTPGRDRRTLKDILLVKKDHFDYKELKPMDER